MSAPVQHTAAEAVATALSLVGTGTYWLGTGDYDTPKGGRSDCAGFAINRCYNIRRHRPGFNTGPWATVSSDLNCNSVIEDAQHKQELFVPVTDGIRPGDLIAYPTFTSQGKQFIGHIAIVTDLRGGYLAKSGYKSLTVVQCCGPNGHTPGIIQTTGQHWDFHDSQWPLPQHRTQVLRVKAQGTA